MGGLQGVIFNDNLKGRYKTPCKEFAEKLGIPSAKHRIMSEPEKLLELVKEPHVKYVKW